MVGIQLLILVLLFNNCFILNFILSLVILANLHYTPCLVYISISGNVSLISLRFDFGSQTGHMPLNPSGNS